MIKIFSEPTGLNKDALRQLLHTGPITPMHQSPANLTGDSTGSSVQPHELQFFDWFDLFPELANRQMANEAWRFQELSDTLLRSSWDGPSYGRRYEIFHNQMRVGLIEVSADLLNDFSVERPHVHTDLTLNFVRVLPFNEVQGFLNWVSAWVAVDENGRVPIDVRMTNLSAMMACLWPTEDEVNDPAFRELELSWTGLATHYISWRQNAT